MLSISFSAISLPLHSLYSFSALDMLSHFLSLHLFCSPLLVFGYSLKEGIHRVLFIKKRSCSSIFMHCLSFYNNLAMLNISSSLFLKLTSLLWRIHTVCQFWHAHQSNTFFCISRSFHFGGANLTLNSVWHAASGLEKKLKLIIFSPAISMCV